MWHGNSVNKFFFSENDLIETLSKVGTKLKFFLKASTKLKLLNKNGYYSTN